MGSHCAYNVISSLKLTIVVEVILVPPVAAVYHPKN
jgi:hypothetical protein